MAVFCFSRTNRFVLYLLLLAASCQCDDNPVCEDGVDCSSTTGDQNSKDSWLPFRVRSKDKWIAFDRLAEKYSNWHESALQNDKIPCKSKRIVVFTPNAGLGDSIGALTTGYLYALRSGRLFFIDWKPYPWSVMFKSLPFRYNYQEVLKMKTKSGKPLICPQEDDPSSFLHGHITTNHPLTKDAERWDFHTDYQSINDYFLQPAKKVEKIIRTVRDGPFSDAELPDDQILHKVAVVMRTGIGEYNQFLSPGDEKIFVSCFRNYAEQYQKRAGDRMVKFVVFVTSDHDQTKQNAIADLRRISRDFSLEVVTLNDSAIHVMHVSRAESREDVVREKLHKTIAEFFLIGMCDAKFLTHGSLFGRAAVERGGGPEETNFFISDSKCDGKREKYSYLECHKPKYPEICNLS